MTKAIPIAVAFMALLDPGASSRADDPQGRGAGPAHTPRLRLAFITTSVEARFFEPVRQGMRDAARMMEVDATFTGTEGVDLPSQAAMVRKAVADGYDGIALNIVNTCWPPRPPR